MRKNNNIKVTEKELISLAPTYEAQDTETIYKKYIDETLSEREYNNSGKYKNKNIAISGGYGAGKSSILNTYFKTATFKEEPLINKVLYVSLGSYIENNDNKLDENEKKAVEVSILQQIIYSVSPEKIPFSRISRKDYKPSNIMLWSLLISVTITPLLLYLLKILPVATFHYNNMLIAISIFLFLLIWWGSYYIINKFNINTVQIGDGKTNVEAKQEDLSLLNKYIDELVYFFKTTDKEIIVFEDIDRLEECQKVFSKLKEINSIINTAIKNKTIRFIYCIGEDVFEDAEKKTKFFDAIIPIIPYLGTNTAREILARELYDEEIPNIEFITIGRFISNPRLAYEIINEYKIYKNNTEYLEKNMKIQLLYLMAYKVLFPKEFEQLIKNEGILSYYISLDFKYEYISHIHQSRIDKWQKEIDKLNEKHNLNLASNATEFVNRIIGKYDIKDKNNVLFYDGDKKYLTSLESISKNPFEIMRLKNEDIKFIVSNREYNERDLFYWYDKDDFFANIESTSVKEQIKELSKKIEEEHNNYINPDDRKYGKEDYIKEYSMKSNHPFFPKSLEIINKTKDDNENKDDISKSKKEIIEEIKLNRFEQILIEKNIINENVKKLIMRKHNEILSANDDAILIKIIDNQEIPLETLIEKPINVIKELGNFSFVNDATAIPALYKEVLSIPLNEAQPYLTAISNKWTKRKFNTLKYVGEKNNIDVLKHFKNSINEMWRELENIDLEENSDLINYYIYQTIKCNLVPKLDENSEFYSTIETKEDIISYLEEKYDEIKDKIKSQSFVFKEEVFMNRKHKNILKTIYENKLFSKCLNHIEEISKVININFDSKKIIESITSNKEERIINELITDDVDDTIRWIKNLNIMQEDSEESLISFINNNELSELQVRDLILKETTTFNDISLLNSKYYNVLKEHNKINGTLINLRALFEANNKEIDESIAEFMAINKEQLMKENFSGDLNKDLRQKFVRCDRFNKEDFSSLNKVIMRTEYYNSVDNFPIDNLKVLIEQKNIILDDEKEYNKIINNENLSLEEKTKVLVDSISNLKDVSNLNLNEEIITNLLNSNVSAQNKADFMLNNTGYIVGKNKDLLFDIMLSEKIEFDKAGILNMLEASKSDNQKIQFYLKYKDDILLEYKIDEILPRMGETFIRIINKENHVYLDNNTDNKTFINHLIDAGMAEKKNVGKNKILIVFGKRK